MTGRSTSVLRALQTFVNEDEMKLQIRETCASLAQPFHSKLK